jgi:TM2 domain-containing membrane protein YozV
MSLYYIAVGSTQKGPFPREHLLAQGLRPDTMVWTDGMAQWQRADSIPELASLFPAAGFAYATPVGFGPGDSRSDPANINGTKVAAGICGILLGALGIHKFILGFTGAGITMLLISVLSCGIGAGVMHIFGIIEGIIYLTKSDAEFYEIYVVQKKAWF